MKALRSLVGGMKALFGKRRRNSDIDEELQSYMDAAVKEKMRRGMDRERALRVVRAEVGSVEVVKHRVWSAGWEAAVESLWSDLRYTVRRLSRSPGLVLTVVLSIGLGIAANATIFSIVSRVLLQPAPVGDPSTLTTLYMTHDGDRCCNEFSAPAYNDVREQAKSFSGVAAYYELVPASIGGNGEPERVWGQTVTANYFDVADLRMTLGRGFSSDEERAPVIVLGHGLWQRRFGGDPAIVGKAISLSGHVYSVVGVAPRGYRGLDLVLDPQFWVPMGDLAQLVPNPPDANSRDSHWFRIAARVRPGVTQAQVIAELKVLAQSLARAHPESDKGNGFLLVKAGQLPPGGPFATAPVFLAALSVVVLLVLCIACANVANLLLALTASRQKEMGVRLALGATRVQLLRQMLMESVVLALGGGLLGVVLSVWSTSALSAFRLPVPIPLDLSVSVDWRVVLYSFLLSLVAGIAFGFVPSWKASRPALSSALKGEDSLARPGRWFTLRDVLVVAQISLSLVLLCATGLFLRSLQGAANIDIGFRSRGLLMMAVDPQTHGYTAARTIQLLTQLRQRVASLPGVNSVATTDIVPLSMFGRRDGFVVEGRPAPTDEPPGSELYMISPDYFETLGIPRIAGRALGDENPDAPKVAVVNEEFARRLFKHDSPLEQRVTGGGVTYQIVGVVGDIKSRTLGEEDRPVLYRSINQNISGDPSFNGYSLMVRYTGDPSALSAAIRHEINSLDPSLAVFNTQTIEEHLRDALFLPRLAGTLFGVFGFIGILLATVGLYGVMSYTVSRRTHEIGIRIALGAQTSAVQKLIVTQGMRLTLIAIALGLPLAFAASKFSASILYGVRPHDVVTFTTIPVIFLVVALLACWIPSRRASRVDPMKTLRCDG
jgi:predicted permease